MAGAVPQAKFQALTANQGEEDLCCLCLYFPSPINPRKVKLDISGKKASPKEPTH